VDNPQKYGLELIKTDIDTKLNMNDVLFEIKAYKQGASELEEEEINLRKASDNTQVIDTKELVTTTVEDREGIIRLDDILIESAGTYYFEFIETTPLEPVIYKDKSENVKVKVDILVEDGKYVIKNMEVVQGEKYVIKDNSEISDSTVITNITNERIKGSYSLEMIKLEELLGKPIQGAQFVIEAYKEVEDIILYKSTDDVTSMDAIIPGKLTITSEDGKFVIEDIRIEDLDSYILKITEIKAPENYTLLREPIELRITPGIKGEYDDAEFVLENIELVSGENDGLVKYNNTEEKIELE